MTEDEKKDGNRRRTAEELRELRKRPRRPMPAQSPEERIKNFSSVVLGYKWEDVIAEAERCLECKNPKCIIGCPAEVDIRSFVAALIDKDIDKAYKVIRENNSLIATCGRVCPQETQCELKCISGIKGEPIAIGRLEQFVGEYALAKAQSIGFEAEVTPVLDKEKIAAVGSGPASLTVAGDLARLGYRVTVFEAFHKPGGVLVYGIPEFRLPKALVEAEIKALTTLGVEIRCNTVVGKLFSMKDLVEKMGYSAIFLGTGAGLPKFMSIPGENANGVMSANEFLTRLNLMHAYEFPKYDTPVFVGKKVAVIGSGNTAMDAARTALRLGAKVDIVYRRTRAESPARHEEVDHAIEEGVLFRELIAPVEVLVTDDFWVRGLKLQRMELGEPDESGRRSPKLIPGDVFDEDYDMMILALGTSPNPIAMRSFPELEVTKRGTVKILDPETGQTSIPYIFAGGDVATGASTVISAIGAGKKAARGIHQYVTKLREAALHPIPAS